MRDARDGRTLSHDGVCFSGCLDASGAWSRFSPLYAFLAQQDTRYEKYRALNSGSSHINDIISMSLLCNIYIASLFPHPPLFRSFQNLVCHVTMIFRARMRDFTSHRLFRIGFSASQGAMKAYRASRLRYLESSLRKYFHTISKFLSVSALLRYSTCK
jgi:hypothetical protein